MTGPLQERVEAAMADLEAQRAKMRDLRENMSASTATASSRNRMVTATVDRTGRLIELKFEGERYRKIAPAELAAKIVETVQEAQADARGQAARAAAAMMPSGMSLFGGPPQPGESVDLDKLLDSATAMLEQSITDGDLGGKRDREATR